LIFFISYLAITGNKKREILLIGISFSLGVFITYLLLGVGFYSLIHTIEDFSLIALIIYPVTAIIAFIFGGYNTYDYLKARAGRKEEMKLKLPKRIKKLISKSIKDYSKLKYFTLIAFFTGVVVSLLEFMCTGQVYLPTIVYIMGIPEYQSKAFLYLLIYNVMFILPLMIIFISVYFGLSSEKLQTILEKRRPHLKIVTAIILYSLGIFILFYFLSFFGY
jgi:cytochrome c biogenesis protein CcdA